LKVSDRKPILGRTPAMCRAHAVVRRLENGPIPGSSEPVSVRDWDGNALPSNYRYRTSLDGEPVAVHALPPVRPDTAGALV